MPSARVRATPGSAAIAAKAAAIRDGLRARALEDALVLEDAQHLERDGGAERIAAEGVSVVEGALAAAEEAVEDAPRRERRGHRQHAAREALRGAEQVGRDARVLAGPHRAGAPVAGEHLVGDEEHVVARAQLARRAQERGVVDPHAGGALHHRLDHQTGDRVGLAREQRFERGDRALGRAGRDRPGDGRWKHSASTPRNGRRNSSTPPIAVAPIVSPWKPSSSATKRVRAGRPFCAQYWSASFSATSTAVEPSSLKKTCSSPGGRDAAERLGQLGDGGVRHARERAVADSRAPGVSSAATRRGWLWPSDATHHDEFASR